MARKKAAPKSAKAEPKIESALIAQIAHAAQREADLIDQLANEAGDFQVQTWEFLIPRQKSAATDLIDYLRGGPEPEVKHYKPGKVFEIVAKALI
jgi:hypothetical protein